MILAGARQGSAILLIILALSTAFNIIDHQFFWRRFTSAIHAWLNISQSNYRRFLFDLKMFIYYDITQHSILIPDTV